MLALGTTAVLPANVRDLINRTDIQTLAVKDMDGDTLLPGAGLLPAAVGSKLTIRNALIGAGAVTGIYIVYALLTAPPKKTSMFPSKPVSGPRRRRR